MKKYCFLIYILKVGYYFCFFLYFVFFLEVRLQKGRNCYGNYKLLE